MVVLLKKKLEKIYDKDLKNFIHHLKNLSKTATATILKKRAQVRDINDNVSTKVSNKFMVLLYHLIVKFLTIILWITES